MMGKTIRLDRFLSEAGGFTRSQAKEAARKGRIAVNGVPERRPERQILPETDLVTADGKPLSYARCEYYMLNKPAGTVSATEDGRYPTVVSLIESRRKDLFPAGRLDLDTEGLLLITNDGELAHQLLSPRSHVDKTYFARVRGPLPKDAEIRFLSGMQLEDGTQVMPARLERLKEEEESSCQQVYLTIQEGKFHQVKRMFETLGCSVLYLKRMSMGPLQLDPALAPGEYRPLTEEEVTMLKNCRKRKTKP